MDTEDTINIFKRVTIIIPVIRPEGAKRCIDAIAANAGIDPYFYDVLAWEDKDRVGCPWMVKCMTTWADTPWVMFLGDDTIPQPGFLDAAFVYSTMLPDSWGVVGLNDGHHNGELLATHWMAHKNMLPLLGGEFFNTAYTHCFCDMELTERSRALGRYVWCDQARIIHDNPVLKRQPLDGDYQRIYSEPVRQKDMCTYYQRKRKGWQ